MFISSNIFRLTIIILAFIALYFLIKIMKNLHKTFMLNEKQNMAIFGSSLFLIALTPFIIPIKIVTKEQLEVLRFGLPFPFIEQHVFANISNNELPLKTTLINHWEHSLAINPISFLMSVGFIYAILYTVVYFTKYFFKYKMNR